MTPNEIERFARRDDHLEEMMQIDSEETKKARKRFKLEWYWNTTSLSMQILRDLKIENNTTGTPLNGFAYWLSLALKFTNDETRNMVGEYIKGRKNYAGVFYGERIYDVMRKYGCTYLEAIFKLYRKNDLKNNRFYNEKKEWLYSKPALQLRQDKMIYSKLYTDNNFVKKEENSYLTDSFGNTIEFYPRNDEYKANNYYGKCTEEQWQEALKIARGE